jgi:hypothetical protein
LKDGLPNRTDSREVTGKTQTDLIEICRDLAQALAEKFKTAEYENRLWNKEDKNDTVCIWLREDL